VAHRLDESLAYTQASGVKVRNRPWPNDVGSNGHPAWTCACWRMPAKTTHGIVHGPGDVYESGAGRREQLNRDPPLASDHRAPDAMLGNHHCIDLST
jgi:hypothetical protein